jgi:transcriptional regulator with XRE-family HTH domain
MSDNAKQGEEATVGAWLAEEIRRRGWSQAEMARRSGLSVAAINKYLRPVGNPHRRTPDYPAVVRMAEALGVAVPTALVAAGLEAPTADSRLRRDCVALVRRLPDRLLAPLYVQLRALADSAAQDEIARLWAELPQEPPTA